MFKTTIYLSPLKRYSFFLLHSNIYIHASLASSISVALHLFLDIGFRGVYFILYGAIYRSHKRKLQRRPSTKPCQLTHVCATHSRSQASVWAHAFQTMTFVGMPLNRSPGLRLQTNHQGARLFLLCSTFTAFLPTTR